MNKTLVVACNEYINSVSSKAFIIGVLMMPLFMGGGFFVQLLTKDQVDTTDRKVAIVDQTERLFDVIAAAAESRNQTVFELNDDGEQKQVQPRFIVERYVPTGDETERADVVLSKQVKRQELFGFLVINEDAFLTQSSSVQTAGDQDVESQGSAKVVTAMQGSPAQSISYYTETPSYSKLPDWLESTVNAEIRRTRMKEQSLDPAVLEMVDQRVRLRRFGLVQADEEGKRIDAKEENKIVTFVVPFGGLMLMFMIIMTIAPTMLNNVLEEKMQKISEFLISSVSPFQLMMGKLLAGIGVALTLSVLYLGAAYGMIRYFELQDRIPTSIYLWFVFFLLLALTIFGSMFSAIGAACSEIRDAQGLMTPVMLMVIIPMICLGPVIEAPSSTFSRVMSLIPPATPMLMFIRIALPPGPPMWEIVLSVVLTVGFAIGCVWAGGKIFRVGILAQGQAATLRNLVQWLFSKE